MHGCAKFRNEAEAMNDGGVPVIEIKHLTRLSAQASLHGVCGNGELMPLRRMVFGLRYEVTFAIRQKSFPRKPKLFGRVVKDRFE